MACIELVSKPIITQWNLKNKDFLHKLSNYSKRYDGEFLKYLRLYRTNKNHHFAATGDGFRSDIIEPDMATKARDATRIIAMTCDVVKFTVFN